MSHNVNDAYPTTFSQRFIPTNFIHIFNNVICTFYVLFMSKQFCIFEDTKSFQCTKRLSIKDVRSQEGWGFVQCAHFSEKGGEGLFKCGRVHFLVQETSDFSIFSFRYSFICQSTSTMRQRSDLFGLRVKLPPVTTSLAPQR